MADEKLNLRNEFPPITDEQWMEVVTKDLKGADFNRRLVWKTNDGIDLQPFYRANNLDNTYTTNLNPGVYPYTRGTKQDNQWLVRQDIKVNNPKEANQKARNILNRGVDALGFRLNKKELTADYLKDLLKDIDPIAVELNFSICTSRAEMLANMLITYFKEQGYADKLSGLNGTIEFDPLNKLLTRGKKITTQQLVEQLKNLLNATAELPNYRTIVVSATTLNNAGAFSTQELGYALAWGNQYLQLLTENGINIEQIAQKIKFNWGVGSNYFVEIAKIRAARTLWAAIVNAYDDNLQSSNATKMKIHAETSRFNTTLYDPYVNLLRTQTEAMSATISGVDSLTVLPFDIAYAEGDDFSERIARNQQLLLKEESHFANTIDPAAGSYFIENLTQEIAQKAWQIFLDVEEQGGFLQAIEKQTIQTTIQTSVTKRKQDIAKGKEVLLGTNKYPNFTEKANNKQTTLPTACGCNTTPSPSDDMTTLLPKRGAEEFEKIRLETEKQEKTPIVFMLTIGNLAMRLARSQFSANFFACAGYHIIDNIGFNTVEEGVEKALDQKADIVVICSSDDAYAEYAPQALQQLQGKAILVVAGAPSSMDTLKAQGVTHFINVKSNILQTLTDFNKILNINS